MKAVILAGGRGARISEESILRPKPIIEIGGMPILWHIMKLYSAAGIYDFVLCLPSVMRLTEAQDDRVCSALRDILDGT